MPYTVANPPEQAKALPKGARAIFVGAFNGALKSYDGDESRAFKVAWAAVKRKYKKDGKRWVLKQEGDVEMSFVEVQRRALAAFAASYPSLEVDRREQALALLDGVGEEPVVEDLLTQMGETFTPVFGLGLLEQMWDRFPGSLDSQIDHVRAALREHASYGRCPYLMAVYPDFAIVCVYNDMYGDEAEYLKLAYTFDPATHEVQFGDATEVHIETMFVPAEEHEGGGEGDGEGVVADAMTAGETAEQDEGAASAGDAAVDEDPQAQAKEQAQKFKTENGQRFTRGAFLVVPDPNLPSTWKVRVEASPGKVTVAQLGAAHAALFKSYRGKTLQATPAQIAAAKRKLRALYKSHNAPFPGDKAQATDAFPAWLLQGDDPPGGEEELVQTITVRLQQEGDIEPTGVMHVNGVATVGNVISKNNEVYPTEVWEDNLPRLQEMTEAGRLLGEADHPEDGRSSVKRTTLKYTSVYQDGDEIKFKADILPTVPDGQNLQVMVQNGVAVDISSRGRGRTVVGTWQGTPNVRIVQRGFRADAFDAVLSGASPGSTITDWSMAQADQSQNVDQEEIEMGEISEKILETLQGLNARLDKLEAGSGGTAGGAPDADASNKTQGAPPAATDAAVGAATGGAQVTYTSDEIALIRQEAVNARVEQELRSLATQWAPQWLNLLRKQLEQADPKTLAEANAAIASRKDLVQSLMSQAPTFPGHGFVAKPGRGEGGPRTPNELIEKLVEGLPDEVADDDPLKFMWQDEDGKEHRAPDWVKTPKRRCRQVLRNVARIQENGFNGPAAITALLRLEQGWDPGIVKEDFLNQACDNCTTSVASGGAPTSAIFIFPLIRRTFPMLIANELSSIQPMDRPSGKIFFLDAYRIEPTTSETDESGSVSSSRMRIDRSESFNPDYSDRAAECDTAACIQLHLSSKDVTAETKALYAAWTIEELQDLRAYHGLDVQTELMGSVARQIALEWNQTILNEMLAGATAGNSIYGTVAPSGYTAKEWEEYLPRYLELASTNIFRKRNGMMTHIVAGPTAWLRLSAAFRAGVLINGAQPELFPGLTLTPFMAGSLGNIKTYMTNFWNAQNTDKILVIRKGPEWSDTPHVWAPYATYMSPTLTLPDVFTQKAGILDRAAHRVVVGDAMATITINGSTGVPVGG